MSSGGTSVASGGANVSGGGSTASGGLSVSGGASSAGGAASAGKGGAAAGSAGCLRDGDGKTTLAFINACSRALTFKGSDIAGGMLAPGATVCVDIGSDTETLSAKRYWGYFGADPGGGRHTLAEFTFNTDFNDFDWYNISHVDAHNVPMQIAPVARPNCKSLSCPEDFLTSCPAAGQFKDSSGALVACVNPERDDGTNPVALYFETCDEAYAWSGDDQNGSDPSPVRACAGEDWNIVFCPGALP
jgi:hypothetical protein